MLSSVKQLNQVRNQTYRRPHQNSFETTEVLSIGNSTSLWKMYRAIRNLELSINGNERYCAELLQYIQQLEDRIAQLEAEIGKVPGNRDAEIAKAKATLLSTNDSSTELNIGDGTQDSTSHDQTKTDTTITFTYNATVNINGKLNISNDSTDITSSAINIGNDSTDVTTVYGTLDLTNCNVKGGNTVDITPNTELEVYLKTYDGKYVDINGNVLSNSPTSTKVKLIDILNVALITKAATDATYTSTHPIIAFPSSQ